MKPETFYVKKIKPYANRGFLEVRISQKKDMDYGFGSVTIFNHGTNYTFRYSRKIGENTHYVSPSKRYDTLPEILNAIKNLVIHSCPGCLPYCLNKKKRWSKKDKKEQCLYCRKIYAEDYKNKVVSLNF